MKRALLCTSICLALLVTLPSHLLSQDSNADAMIAAAEALDKAFMDAVNRGDVEAINALYWNSPDLVSFPPDSLKVQGYEALAKANAEFLAGMKGAKLEFLESHHMPVGDAVVSWGLWRMTVPGPDGQTLVMEGRSSDVKAQRDGKWVYIMDHASVPMAPPPE